MLNKYMEAQAPWKLAKTDMKAANRVLYTAAEGLRIATIMLAPVMPEKTAACLGYFRRSEYQACLGTIKTRHRFKSPSAVISPDRSGENLMAIETIKWVNGCARIIDQTKLPNKFEYIYCRDVKTHVAGDQTFVRARSAGHRCGRGFWGAFGDTEI